MTRDGGNELPALSGKLGGNVHSGTCSPATAAKASDPKGSLPLHIHTTGCCLPAPHLQKSDLAKKI